jgi:hypothetical protein
MHGPEKESLGSCAQESLEHYRWDEKVNVRKGPETVVPALFSAPADQDGFFKSGSKKRGRRADVTAR